MRTAIRYVLPATFALLLAATTAEAQTRNILFGAVGGGTLSDLFILNPANGSVIADLGPTGFSITGLRFDPTTGILYGSTANVGPSRGSLITLNPITGTGTLVGSFGIANHTMADITFTKNGTLYGWAEPQRDDLHIINKATGAATDVGNAGISTFGSGLSANSKDVLYYTGSGGTGPLRIIDKATGLPTTVATLSGAPLGNGPINALAFNSADVLYGVQGTFGGTTHLITINAVTGVITDLGTSLNGLDALAFLFSNDPEELSAIYQIGFSQATVQALNLQRRMDDIRAGSRGFCDNVTVMPSGKDMSGGKGPSDGKTALLPTPASDFTRRGTRADFMSMAGSAADSTATIFIATIFSDSRMDPRTVGNSTPSPRLVTTFTGIVSCSGRLHPSNTPMLTSTALPRRTLRFLHCTIPIRMNIRCVRTLVCDGASIGSS